MSKAEEISEEKEVTDQMSEKNLDTSATIHQIKSTRVFEFYFGGDKTSELNLKDAVIANIIVGVIALAIYFPVEYLGHFEILGSEYYFHVVLMFVCFAVVPIIYLAIFQIKTGKAKYFFLATKKGMSSKKIISSLIQGCVMHAGLFYPWILLSQKYMTNVNPIRYFLFGPGEWIALMSFFALNVIVFEFYSKAFIQIQFSQAKGSLKLFNGALEIKSGKMLGFILQNIAWLGGHIQEFFWLRDYIGVANSIFFIIVSGVLTGLTVMETENIFGVSFGHVLLNVLIIATYAV